MTQNWQEIARGLPIGSKRKVVCCSTDPSSYISNGDRGISLGPCFRCGEREWEPHGERSIAEIMATRRAFDDLAKQAEPTMPADAVPLSEGPSKALLWVLQGGLTPELAQDRYGMRWHEKSRRVLIPCPGGILGRAVHGERPKYDLAGKPGGVYWPEKRAHSAVVVVEDCLSAIAVDRAGCPAAAVLGTSISSVQAAEIATGRKFVVGWFDGDKAGDQAYVRLRKCMGLYDVTVHRIRTDRDPKLLHRSELRERLSQYIGD